MLVILVVAFVILNALFPADLNGYGKAARAATCQQTRAIGTAMYRYSLDHNGQYPTGKSSTEVFQKLIDGGYVSDPTFFFMGSGSLGSGKTPATSKVLKPENVSFDVTVPILADSPNGLPIVFLSGFKITYEPGADAVATQIHFSQWGGITAAYKDDKHPTDLSIQWFGRFNVVYQMPSYKKVYSDPIRIIPHFIPADFDPKGQKFQQLTPDGPMAP